MAHFFRPAGEPPSGFHVDGKLAPDSVWKIDAFVNRPRTVGLFEGSARLSVASNNPSVVANSFDERGDGRNRFLTITGLAKGTSLINVRQDGVFWFCLQVQVFDAPLDQNAKLTASVGRGGANRPDDVKLVRMLLNTKLATKFELNGIVNNELIATIERYQRTALGQAKPDGRIDPGGATFRSLTGGRAPQEPSTSSGSGTTNAEITARVLAIKEGPPREMSLSSWRYLLEFTSLHEFPVFHMYNNRATETAKNDVTCGIGHFLKDEAAAVAAGNLFFDKETKNDASPQQLRNDWNEAAKLTRKRGKENNLSKYGENCQLRMHIDRTYEDMAKILKGKLSSLLAFDFRASDGTRMNYRDFPNFPDAAKVFCVSFSYGRLPIDFPKLNLFIRDKNWAGASGECRLSGGSGQKNEGHRRLLLFAQEVVDRNADLKALPPMFA